MRLLILTTFLASPFLTLGCAKPIDPTPIDAALFCDVVPERAWFTQAEIDARTEAGFTRNLAWQYRVNLSWDRECSG